MKRFLSILAIASILLGNTGLTLGMHYCMGRLVETQVDFGTHLAGCGKAMESDESQMPIGTVFAKSKHCCQDHYLQFQTDDHAAYGTLFSMVSPEVAYTFPLVAGLAANIPSKVALQYNFSTPPLLPTDRQSLLQVYLI